MKTVIQTENLGKKYLLHHNKRAAYQTLRETISSQTKSLFQKKRIPTREEFWALQDIAFTVAAGEKVGIIGRNGAGKTTLLKILSRITEPSSGRVTIRGRIASLLEVGTGFHPELTGRENIFLNGAILGMRRNEIKKKFDEIVTFAEIEKFLDTPVKRYSSGMYLRLAFAVAAHLESDILLIDEVLAVGDFQFQKKCLGKMEEVGKQGRTILFVSHNMGAIITLCTRAVIIDCGTIKYSGNTLDAITEYRGTLKNGTFIDLRNYLFERRGPQKFAKFVSMSIFDSNGNQKNTFSMGESFCVKLQIDFKKPVKYPRIGVMLRNSMGVLIHDFVSAFEGFFIEPKTGTFTLEISVPELKVYPGSYTLGPWIQKQVGIASDDYIGAALKITVADDKLLAHPDSKFDIIHKEGTETYQSSKWKIIPNTP